MNNKVKNKISLKTLILLFFVLSMIVTPFYLGYKGITGFAVFDPKRIFDNITGNGKDTDTIDNITDDNIEDSTKDKEDEEKSIIDKIKESIKEKLFKEPNIIDISADLEFNNFDIEIEGKDITIESEMITIISPDIDIKSSANSLINLDGFKGNLIYNGAVFYLKGKLNRLLSNDLTINWKGKKEIEIMIINGKVAINDMEIDKIDGIATGSIRAVNVDINLNNDQINIKDYKGSFESVIENEINTIFLEGTVRSLDSKSKDINLDIK